MIVRHPHLMAVPRLTRPLTLTIIAVVMLGLRALSGRLDSAQTGSLQFDEMVFESYRHAEPLTDWPSKKLLHEIPELKGLEPAADQSLLPGILTRVGENVKALLANFMNTTALETIAFARARAQLKHRWQKEFEGEPHAVR